MRVRNIPFNITLLNPKLASFMGLLPVTSTSINDIDGAFHKDGLYSEDIFGAVGSKDRNDTFGYIELKAKVLHPKVYDELHRLNKTYTGIMNGTTYGIWDDKAKDFIKSDMLEGETGYAFFMSHWQDLVFPVTKSPQRDLRINLINKFRDIAPMAILAVLPAGLRDIQIDDSGRSTEDPISKIYRKFLIYAGSIPEGLINKNDKLTDRTRSLIQRNLQDLYKELMTILAGKRGFLQNKWASRAVSHSSRNVLTSVEHGGESLDSANTLDMQTTIVGLYQSIKSLEPLLVYHHMGTGIAKDLVTSPNYPLTLTDTKTLLSVDHTLKEKARSEWGTPEGRAGLISNMKESANRNKPVLVDGYYLRLVYQDDIGIQLLASIEDLDETKDKDTIHPLTWAEYFYLETYKLMPDIRADVTRYPVTSMNSTYPSKLHMRTTIDSFILKMYDAGGKIIEGITLPEYPDITPGAAFFDATGVHYSMLDPLNGDMDGDTVSCTYVMSKDGVADIDKALSRVENYITSGGDLVQPTAQVVHKHLLANFTGF